MVIKSKLVPPQPRRDLFQRVKLQEKYRSSLLYPLTLVHAGTGFGKTTALLELCGVFPKVLWYTITEPDRDPALFLAHLLSVFLPGSSHLLERLEAGGIHSFAGILTTLINQLTADLEEDTILVLDDYHLVSDVTDISHWMEQLVENHPPRLHIAIATRKIPETPSFVRWRVKNELQIIDQEDLAFTRDEICRLYTDHYGFSISDDQVESLYTYTDGWIIALQLVWQRLQAGSSRQLDTILAELPTSFTEVFNFLAQDVLMRQPQELQEFLVSTSVLRQLDAAACDALLERNDSREVLKQLVERGLFTFSVDETTHRYQRLFQDFLLEQGGETPEELQSLHKKAAAYYQAIGNSEEAIYHLLSGGEKEAAASQIEIVGPGLLSSGRLRTIAKWIESLDEQQLNQRPSLWLLSGDVKRLRSNFDGAISDYSRAEKLFKRIPDFIGRSQSLRKQAQVYLDTIRPLAASNLLEEAISLLEPQEHPLEVAGLLDQLAENKLNLGKPGEARLLHHEASMLRSESDPDDIYLEARALLRTGRLQEAVTLMEGYTAPIQDKEPEQRAQRFHREVPLLLSLIHLMLGNVQQGEAYARQGIETGKQLDSPFVEAVGWMRLGHAFQLYPHVPWLESRLQEAAKCYHHAIDQVRPFNVVRVQVEPLWGLARLHGYQGNLDKARRYTDQAIEIADGAGDQWFVALLKCTMGTAYTLAGNDAASQWLTHAHEGFSEVDDVFGQSAAAASMLLHIWKRGTTREAFDYLASTAPHFKKYHTGIVLTQPTHVGLQDTQSLVPILLKAYGQGIEKEWIEQLLPALDPGSTSFHPGYGLSVRTLGPYQVWRGAALTNSRDWQREKARQLMQFFVHNRGKWLTREQLSDALWPDLDADSSTQNLKVALNALNRALEPLREPGQNPFFISRREAGYGINPAACISIDVDDFTTLSALDSPDELREALDIYQGDYLSDTYESWPVETREFLRERYLLAAQRLANWHLAAGESDAALKICHEILSTDPCNEPAFRILMRCHAARGNQAAIHSVYQRCTNALEEDLGVAPSRETSDLYHELIK